MPSTLTDALCTLQVEGIPPDVLRVQRWHGREAISQPYRFVIHLVCDDAELEMTRLVGTHAKLAVRDGEGWRTWHGVITMLTDVGEAGSHDVYEAVLEPRLALLREFQRSDVFLNDDIASVIHYLLPLAGMASERGGVAGYSYDYAISIPARTLAFTRSNFMCQFEESSLDFLQRRLEREGLYYWFEQHEDREAVVFGDDRQDQPRLASPLTWRPEKEIDPERDVAPVMRLSRRMTARAARVKVNDFAASRADLSLLTAVDVARLGASSDHDATQSALSDSTAVGHYAHVGEHTFFGDHFDGQSSAQRHAQLRAHVIACQADRFDGASRAASLQAGGIAQLQGHPRAAYNKAYCIIEVEHHGSQPLPGDTAHDERHANGEYRNTFVAIPYERQFRPQRHTRWPRITGMISAVIEAEGSGLYAELNENGCYKVRFPFADEQHNDGHNSAWIRMASPYAGDGHGMHLPLVKDTEVLVAFIGGDPDRPVIVGAVANSENRNLLHTRNATKGGLRTQSGNALAFHESLGREAAFLGSPKGNSHLSLGWGENDKNGVHLRSDEHMGLRSTSYKIDIPGLFVMTIGQDDGSNTPPSGDPADIPTGDPGSSSSSDASADTVPDDYKKWTEDFYTTHRAQEDAAAKAAADQKKADDDAKKSSYTNPTVESKTSSGITNSASWGLNNSVFFGMKNDMFIGATVSISASASTGFKLATSKAYTLTDKYNYDVTMYSKKVKEDINVVESNFTAAQQTVKAVKKTEKLGSYSCEALANYEVDAVNTVAFYGQHVILGAGLPGNSIIIDASSIYLSHANETWVTGKKETMLGSSTCLQTIIQGAKIDIGSSTAILGLQAAKLGIDITTARLNATGPLSLEGGLVKIG